MIDWSVYKKEGNQNLPEIGGILGQVLMLSTRTQIYREPKFAQNRWNARTGLTVKYAHTNKEPEFAQNWWNARTGPAFKQANTTCEQEHAQNR